ncbi:hypothetical protein RYH80_08200 [Halobaculum sp. MBLA0147]|uniref:hypothetical protein n=1 Tax=Halobaculum sp. MBLA0147 TaxID=3079934 RepID=UPI0035250701
MTRHTAARIAVVLGVCLLLVTGAAGTVTALERTTVAVDTAVEDESTETLAFTFTADSDATVSAPDEITRDGGAVTFAFDSWEATDGSDDGTSREWSVTSGTEYRVTYEVTATDDAGEQTYDADVEITDEAGGVVHSERLEGDVDILEPSFGSAPSPDTTVELAAGRDSDETATVTATVENDGDGTMVVSDASFSGLPDGIEPAGDPLGGAGEIAPGRAGSVELRVSVGPDVSEGSYDFQATVEDSLGNTQTFPVTVTVDELRPEITAVDGDTTVEIDRVGEGDSETAGVSLAVTNGGDGDLFLEDVSFTTPDGVTAAPTDVPDRIEAGTTGQVGYDLSVDRTTSTRSITVSGTLTNSLGESRQFSTEVDVDVLFPELGDPTRPSERVVFDSPDDSSLTVAVGPRQPNTGNGNMRLASVSVDGLPDGFSVEDTGVERGVIEPGSSGRTAVELAVADSVDEGTYDVDGTITDSLGNTRPFTAEVTVVRPPIVGFDETPVDLGNVLVGSEQSVTVGVRELGGASRIDDLSATVRPLTANGSLRVEPLRTLRVAPGGRSEAPFTVAVAGDAPQHERLEWELSVEPEDQNAQRRTVPVTARVIYPPELTDVRTGQTTFEFDRPRPTDDYTQTRTVSFANAGDLEMDVRDVSASVSGTATVDATVTDVPATVEGLSNGSATVEVVAPPETAEGEYTLTVTVRTAEGGTETITRPVTVDHRRELAVETTTVSYGEVTITDERTRTLDVGERLGYEDLTGFSIERVSGPDRYLTLTSRPDSPVTAGESEPAVFTLQFDTSAQPYREYEWAYRISGDRVESRTVTVTARARPFSFDSLRENLSAAADEGAWREPLAGGVTTTLDELEGRLRNNESVSSDALPTTLSVARATLLYVDAVERAQAAQADGDYATAQRFVVRAAVARNQLVRAASDLSSSVGEPLERTTRVANETLATVVADQRSHYVGRLDESSPFDRRANARRALARLDAIDGAERAAARNRSASQTATERYLGLVTNASRDRAAAEAAWQSVRDNATVVVAGQPLVLNPTRFTAVTDRLERIDGLYATAVSDYRTAGAASEADTVADRRGTVAGRAQLLRYGLYGSAGVYGLVTLAVVVGLGRRVISYYEDTREATLGDFLLEPAEA